MPHSGHISSAHSTPETWDHSVSFTRLIAHFPIAHHNVHCPQALRSHSMRSNSPFAMRGHRIACWRHPLSSGCTAASQNVRRGPCPIPGARVSSAWTRSARGCRGWPCLVRTTPVGTAPDSHHGARGVHSASAGSKHVSYQMFRRGTGALGIFNINHSYSVAGSSYTAAARVSREPDALPAPGAKKVLPYFQQRLGANSDGTGGIKFELRSGRPA
jgi:hypothetical protein